MVDDSVDLEGIKTTILQWYQPDLTIDPTTGILRISPSSSSSSAGKYVPPEPVPGPAHSFIGILYRQPPGFKVPSCLSHVLPPTVPNRIGFNLDGFVDAALLGTPVAANWFREVNASPAPAPSITATKTDHYVCASTPAPSLTPSSTPTPVKRRVLMA